MGKKFIIGTLFVALAVFACEIETDPRILLTGMMAVDPESPIPADGQTKAEVMVIVYAVLGEGLEPVPGVHIELVSSRNQGGNQVDTIEQPTSPTDADGKAIASIWSSTPGELFLRAIANGEILCADWIESECYPLEVLMEFVE